jgi:oxygen-independent coproporphyrinogen-3 oxidase
MEGNTMKEFESLDAAQELNEYIMTALRTMEGINMSVLPPEQAERIMHSSEKYINNGLLKKTGDQLHLTKEGRLLADGIAADLFC